LFILISFVLISLLLINAENIKTSFPAAVKIGEEFEIEMILIDFIDDIYAIKFNIKEGNKNLAQRLWQEEWKSTHYWIYEAFKKNEKKKEFRLKIVEGIGENDFIIKIRNSSGYLWTFNNQITIINDNYKNSSEDKNKENKIGKENRESDKKNSYKNQKNNKSEKIKNKKISLKWIDDEIINGKEFDIEVNSDLMGKDIRLWIEKNGEIISERYDEENNEWKSGRYYINNFNDESIKLRIKRDYKDFNGNADLIVKTRDGKESKETVSIIKNYEVLLNETNDTKNIVIEKKVNEENNKNKINIEKITNGDTNIAETSNTIKLGFYNENQIYNNKSNIIYESKNQIIRKYSIYIFAIFIIIFIILIVWRKL